MPGILLALVLASPVPIPAQPSPAPRRSVLQLVAWADPGAPGWVLLGDGFREQVKRDYPGDVEFFAEFLDLSRARGPEYEAELATFLRSKYAGRIDVVAAFGAPALDVALGHRGELLPGVPIVFGLLEERDLARLEPGPDVTGVTLAVEPGGTLEAALALQPDIRRVFVIGGTAPLDQARLADARREFEAYRGRFDFTYWDNLPMSDLVERVRALPPRSIVVVLHVFRDGAGADFRPYDSFAMIARASNVPVYGVLDSYLGGGMVGGKVGSFSEQGRVAGGYAARILAGTEPARLPVRSLGTRTTYDWRQLERWGLSERPLPAGAVVRFRSPPVWEQYPWYIAGALVIGLLEAGLIGALLFLRSARQRVDRALREQVRFLSLVIELSSSSHRQSPDTVDRWLEDWLGRLGRFLGLDRAALIEERLGLLQVTQAWSAAAGPPPRPVHAESFPWSTGHLRRGETVRVSRLAELPAEAAPDREVWEREGVRSLLAIPLVERDWTLGALVLTTYRSEQSWAPEIVTHLRLVGDIFASVLVARRAESARAASERLSATLLGVLSGPTAVLDQESTVVNANGAWLRLGHQPGRNGLPWTPVGGKYLEACGQAAAAAGSPITGEALQGIRSVLAGARREFRLKYNPPSQHPKELIVVPLSRPEEGSVVSYIDTTDLERAEREAQELRQTIAHFDRVATLGDLSASLAHELNQPLTAILTNVQAARRFLDAGPQNLGEVREILTDIEEDDRRAGEVIRRLRALLRKDTATWEPLHLHALIAEVVHLVAADTRARQVAVRLDLDETLSPVRGDRVQLSQVILNLVMNGADAMQHTPPADRELLIRTWRYDDRSVALSARDRGTGIQAAPIERIFEPFYTSKSEGLGMGLSICQTILKAHGGRIWATNNPVSGATFHVVLPTGWEERG
ncbi:MAG TPA: ATP-binding protein [Gemmatimonadales bacterium]|nr:ATP-binding protein [Gemmatimonadales bacterium]